MQIPFQSFELQNAQVREPVLQAMAAVYDSNWYILGDFVKTFEQEYAAFNGTQYCIGVGNGLDALHIALKSLGIGPGDEVLVPAHTFIATWLAVSLTGAQPVPVEPDPLTFNVDPAQIEKLITRRTKALIPVHLYGQPCNMEALLQLARHYRLWVIEDNAQAQGATFEGQITGSFGHLNATSFYPTKNLGALGDAGALTTNHPDLAYRARTLRNYGSAQLFRYETIGLNSRLDELQATILSQKLKFLSPWNQERNRIAELYTQNMQELSEIILPQLAPGATHVYHQYVIRTPHRDALQRYLALRNIGTYLHYPVPPHRQPAYEHLGFRPDALPVTNKIAATCLSLPIWPSLDEEKIYYLCGQIKKFFRIGKK